jgi:hypothetical protein
MTTLSPAAQAVLGSVSRQTRPTKAVFAADRRQAVAAALRAAADQLGYCRAPGEFEHLYGRIVEVDDLLAIAAELDGATTTREKV